MEWLVPAERYFFLCKYRAKCAGIPQMAWTFLFKLVLFKLILLGENGNLTKQLLLIWASKNQNFGRKSLQNGGTSYRNLMANELVQAIIVARNFNLL